MTEDVKPEVIKRTQESLGKYIKRPPLTEKLLKKPPFRFLHDIVTSVIRDTGFLQGLLTEEELSHENIKDRDSKVAFLQKVIDAVKTITGAKLTVRPTKIVAGHEASKTNEFLQAIGSALDKKLSSADYVAQIQKTDKGPKVKASTSKDEGIKSKSTTGKSTSQARGPSQERSKTKDLTKKKTPSDASKRSKTSVVKTEVEQGAAASSISAVPVVSAEQPAKSKASTSKSETPSPEKKESKKEKEKSIPPQLEKHEADASQSEKPKAEDSLPGKRRSDSARRERLKSATLVKPESQPEPSVSGIEPQTKAQQEETSQVKVPETGQIQGEVVQNVEKEPEVERPRTAHENRRKSARLKSAKDHKSAKEPVPVISAATAKAEISPRPLQTYTAEEFAAFGTRDSDPAILRPKSVRPKSARPNHLRPKSRIEVKTADQNVDGEVKVKVITESDSFKEQDEDENFVVVEAPTVLLEDALITPAVNQALQAGGDNQHGHLVAQILETQKELEDEAQRSLPHDSQNKKVDIEWDDAGRQREREIVSKEVERLRNSIQTLTRAANPLGKLMDFLQEDVDTMQRELSNWRIMNNDLRRQLLEEERNTEISIEPLKGRLAELKEKIEMKVNEISSARARIMENEVKLQRNMPKVNDFMGPEFEGEILEIPEIAEEIKMLKDFAKGILPTGAL